MADIPAGRNRVADSRAGRSPVADIPAVGIRVAGNRAGRIRVVDIRAGRIRVVDTRTGDIRAAGMVVDQAIPAAVLMVRQAESSLANALDVVAHQPILSIDRVFLNVPAIPGA